MIDRRHRGMPVIGYAGGHPAPRDIYTVESNKRNASRRQDRPDADPAGTPAALRRMPECSAAARAAALRTLTAARAAAVAGALGTIAV
ncbi:hypothetical protein F3J12_20085, partial [Burkholderia sp. Ax-1735]|uniref:hypothetical protein n=1 Tax=Burkholderia sp. Ax-1735 TaxID=2608329 RepID=UPI00141E082F